MRDGVVGARGSHRKGNVGGGQGEGGSIREKNGQTKKKRRQRRKRENRIQGRIDRQPFHLLKLAELSYLH